MAMTTSMLVLVLLVVVVDIGSGCDNSGVDSDGWSL